MPARFKNKFDQTQHSLRDILRWKLLGKRPPAVPVADINIYRAAQIREEFSRRLAADGLRTRLVWIGHATFLLHVADRVLLIDPIFGDCGPWPLAVFKRARPPALNLQNLPQIDEVLISHSHYDHLDLRAVRGLGNAPRYWLPIGLKKWFAQRGCVKCREFGWGDSVEIADGLTLHCVSAQHGSARTPWDRDRTLWCGWVLQTSELCIYLAGDTGYSPQFTELRKQFPRIDLAVLPIGAYEPRWLMKPVHMNPADAVQAHLDLGAKLSVAGHWGTFRLADDPLDEPPRKLAEELEKHGMDEQEFRVLRPGETLTL